MVNGLTATCRVFHCIQSIAMNIRFALSYDSIRCDTALPVFQGMSSWERVEVGRHVNDRYAALNNTTLHFPILPCEIFFTASR